MAARRKRRSDPRRPPLASIITIRHEATPLACHTATTSMDLSNFPHCRRLRVLAVAFETQPAANRQLLTGPATPGDGYATMDLSGRVVSDVLFAPLHQTFCSFTVMLY